MHYFFCPQCKGILQPKRGAPGGGKFVINKKNIEISLKNAVLGKKLEQSSSDDAKQIAIDYFNRSRQNSVQIMGAYCVNCGLETATLTLSHKNNDFRKKYSYYNYQQQVDLYNSIFGHQSVESPVTPVEGTPAPKFVSEYPNEKVSFCSKCGLKREETMKFCAQCGQKFEN